ncbi:uncharacterized protein LOC141595551 [Silene latifolia]|uniref:uncharacterized protein LOC141595551 n=1 Tax=Silene latifolia TaxID=37657 RepID=UPI003D772D7C
MERAISTGNDEKYSKYNEEVKEFSRAAAIFWKQRAKLKWMVEGDTCTKFFFNWVKGRAGRNFIMGLKEEDGTWVFDSEKIKQSFHSNFVKLFNPERSEQDVHHSQHLKELLNECYMRINNDDADWLQRPFTPKEVRCADATKAILSILNSGAILKELNRTFITLIPKCDNPEGVHDYRPISLCNVIMRIVSRCITNRLAKVMGYLIGDFQNAFLPGRQISDNILLAHEAMHKVNSHKKGKTGRFAFKADMSKAYDRVLFNGAPLQLFQPNCGLRQGDPLSPYLFVLCMEVLSKNVLKLQNNGTLKGITLAQGERQLTHLFFADDAVFFLHDKDGSVKAFNKLLRKYCKESGQIINEEKSGIIFSPSTKIRKARECMRNLKIKGNKGMGNWEANPHFISSIKSLKLLSIGIQGTGISDEGGTWKNDMIKELFSDENANKILAMPLCNSRKKDTVFWPYSSSGEYNVKSGYGILFSKFMELKGSEKDKERTEAEEKTFCRRKLWKLPGPAMWKILIWRIITDTLPVGVNFERRNFQLEIRCKLCGYEEQSTETMEHLFRDCEISKRLWACTELGIRASQTHRMHIRKWVMQWIIYLEKLEEGTSRIIRFMATLWCIWCVRNRIVFKGESFHPLLFLNLWIQEVRKADEALLVCNKDKVKKAQEAGGMGDKTGKWIRESKPFFAIGAQYNCECIRVMVDAGWKSKEKASLGWVAYTETGQLMAEKFKAIKAESALQAEALGLREVVLWAKEEGRWHVEVSTDCLPLIAFSAGSEKAHHMTKAILEDILALSGYFQCLSFSYIPRSSNKVAHSLAQKAMTS